jgi:hypothetical protein
MVALSRTAAYVWWLPDLIIVFPSPTPLLLCPFASVQLFGHGGRELEPNPGKHVLLISLVCLCSWALKVLYIGASMGKKLGTYYNEEFAVDCSSLLIPGNCLPAFIGCLIKASHFILSSIQALRPV